MERGREGRREEGKKEGKDGMDMAAVFHLSSLDYPSACKHTPPPHTH